MSEENEDNEVEPNWSVSCDNCEQIPTVGTTGLCGPCCFGEADAIDWWDD